MPHEVYNAPYGSKRFMYASTVVALEEDAKRAKELERQAKRGGATC